MVLTVLLNVVYFAWMIFSYTTMHFYAYSIFPLWELLISLLPCAAILLSVNGHRKKAIVCVGVALALNAAGLLYEFLPYSIIWWWSILKNFDFRDVVSEIALLVFLCLKKKTRWVWIGVGAVLTVLLSSNALMGIVRTGTMSSITYCIPQMSLGFVYLFGFMDPHHEFVQTRTASVMTPYLEAYKREHLQGGK